MGNPAPPTNGLPLRYAVVGVTVLMSVLLYLDRACIAFNGVYIRENLGIGGEGMSVVLGAFFFAYALAQVPTGWLTDRFGPRLMLFIYILAWSLFTAGTGLAVGLVTLLVARIAFGAAQAGAYPTAAVIIGQWVPVAGRGRASSLVALGGRLGAAVAPLLTALLLLALVPADNSEFRDDDILAPVETPKKPEGTPGLLRERVFDALPTPARDALADLITPGSSAKLTPERANLLAVALNDVIAAPDLLAGLEWPPGSLPGEARALLDTRPRTQPQTERLNRLAVEAAFPGTVRQLHGRGWREVMFLYGAVGLAVAAAFWFVVPPRAPGMTAKTARHPGIPWALLLGSRNLFLSSLLQFAINLGWAFLITLLPQFLEEAHRVPIAARGMMAMVPFLTGCVGMLLGGWLTDWLSARLGRRWGRAMPIGLTQLLCATAYLTCPWLPGAWAVIAALSVMAFAVDLGIPALWAFVQDIGGRHTGTALGWGNMWGNFGAGLSPILLVFIQRATGGWTAVFVTCAGSFLVAAGAGLLIDATRPLEPRAEASGGA